VGTTKLFRKRTATAIANSIRFTVFSPLDCELDRDHVIAATLSRIVLNPWACPEFVTL
jgi:hypothetical protein